MMRQYAAACERGDDKYKVNFEYGWIYRDLPSKSKNKVKKAPPSSSGAAASSSSSSSSSASKKKSKKK
jgi:hypothetical protein